MITSTTDPISMNEVNSPEDSPYVIEGDGQNALRIYFESEENKQEYLAISLHGSESSPGLKKIFDAMADNPDTGTIN